MLANKSMFIAVSSIQSSMGNPSPRLVAWIALVGQILAPILMLLKKYFPARQDGVVITTALLVSVVVVLIVAKSIEGYRMKGGSDLVPRIKVGLVLFLSIVGFIGIGSFSPEGSMAAYFAYCCLPLQRLLNLPIVRCGNCESLS